MPDEQPDIAAELRRGLRRLGYATIALYLVLAAAGGYVWWREHQTHKALCTLRADLEQRVQGGHAFLAKNPHGIPGLPAATIRVSIAGQERTIQALDPLHCSTKGTP